MKYYLIAGEASGDLHGSNLMKGLKAADSDSRFRYWGGDLMKAEGGTLVRHYKDGAIMGFVEVLCKLGTIFSNLKLARRDILEYRPDVLILIDYPGFNFKMARFARKHRIKVFYYIAPKVWAWKESRVKRLQRDIDRLFIIFPFEIEYFRKWNIDAVYCGNPLLDKIESSGCMTERREDFIQRHGLDENRSIIALLAGSRKSEIGFLLPIMKQIAERYHETYQFVLGAAPSIERSFYDGIIGKTDIVLIENDTYSLLRHARSAIISSGTASLEAALIGTPQVVCYGGNPISYYIARKLVKVKYISLGNLIVDRPAFRELIQTDCTAEKICDEIRRIDRDDDYRSRMLADYEDIRKALGETGASYRVAQQMTRLLKQQNIQQ